MAQYQVSVAAASAPVGTDLFANETWKRRPFARLLRAVGVKGSAAGGDTEIELFIGETRIANVFNVDTGLPNRDNAMPVGRLIPPNEELRAIVVDAPATNPINLFVDLMP